MRREYGGKLPRVSPWKALENCGFECFFIDSTYAVGRPVNILMEQKIDKFPSPLDLCPMYISISHPQNREGKGADLRHPSLIVTLHGK